MRRVCSQFCSALSLAACHSDGSMRRTIRADADADQRGALPSLWHHGNVNRSARTLDRQNERRLRARRIFSMSFWRAMGRSPFRPSSTSPPFSPPSRQDCQD
jgi:hypothetical protein